MHQTENVPRNSKAPTLHAVRQAKPRDLDFIQDLHRKNSGALGFIPAQGVAAYIDARRVIIGQLNEHEAGYLLFQPASRDQPGTALIHQACVRYDARFRAVGRSMLATVENVARRSGSATLQLWCRCELESNRFWLDMGFEPIGVKPGGNERKLPLIGWRRRVVRGSPIDFPFVQRSRSEAGRPVLIVCSGLTAAIKRAIAAGSVNDAARALREALRRQSADHASRTLPT